MNEYKFRAQRTDNKEWVYGDLLKQFYKSIPDDSTVHYFIYPFQNTQRYEVIPETVGMFTGLKDWYEGDILEHTNFRGTKTYTYIKYNEQLARFEMSRSINCSHKDLKEALRMRMVKVSNIHEATPEQLKEWGLE